MKYDHLGNSKFWLIATLGTVLPQWFLLASIWIKPLLFFWGSHTINITVLSLVVYSCVLSVFFGKTIFQKTNQLLKPNLLFLGLNIITVVVFYVVILFCTEKLSLDGFAALIILLVNVAQTVFAVFSFLVTTVVVKIVAKMKQS